MKQVEVGSRGALWSVTGGVALCVLFAAAVASADGPLVRNFNSTQSLEWLRGDIIAQGQWDGTLRVYRYRAPTEAVAGGIDLVSSQALVLDSDRPPGRTYEPVRMITRLDDRHFVTAAGPAQIALWYLRTSGEAVFLDFVAAEGIGTADSGVAFAHEGRRYLATGHEDGRLVLWERDTEGLRRLWTRDLFSDSPVPGPVEPWPSFTPPRNVRDIALWRGTLLTVAEDGDLVMSALADGAEIARHRYSGTSRFGLNSFAVVGDRAYLVNCPTVPSESNLWAVRLEQDGMVADGDVRLGAPGHETDAVFAFDVEALTSGGHTDLLITTEHGSLWVVDPASLTARRSVSVAPSEPGFNRSAAIAVHPGGTPAITAGTELRAFAAFPR